MVKIGEVYKCSICGNVVEVLHAGGGELVCCNESMQLMKENMMDASKEKHVPVIERAPTGFRVKVGSAPHPMESGHCIEWIELNVDGKVSMNFLKPGERPETEFQVDGGRKMFARAYCNLHGLWKN